MLITVIFNPRFDPYHCNVIKQQSNDQTTNFNTTNRGYDRAEPY